MSNDTDKKLETIKSDTKDTLDEAKHRTQAAGERFSRDIQGDDMPDLIRSARVTSGLSGKRRIPYSGTAWCDLPSAQRWR